MESAQEAEGIQAVISWAASYKISLETSKIIVELGFTSMEAVECLTADDIKGKKIPIGQQKLLLKAVAGLGANQAPTPAPGVAGGNHPPHRVEPSTSGTSSNVTNSNVINVNNEDAFLHRLTSELRSTPAQGATAGTDQVVQASQVQQGSPITGNYSWTDPQVYLKGISGARCAHYAIVDFVDISSSPVERVVSSNDDFEIVCRSGTRKPKLENISISQWSGANIAILYRLHQDGTLGLPEVFDYLSYTSHIYSLISSHELISVFYYDQEYRRLQAMHKFRWGTAIGHLAPGFLRLRNPGTTSHKVKSGYEFKRTSGRTNHGHSSEGRQICRGYNSKSGCNYRNCKFEHVCNVPGCAKTHPSFAHTSQSTDTKN